MNERHLETIHELFERQVSRTPHTVALFDFGSDGKRQLTFSELNVASNQFANNLLARGCRSEDVIAVGMVHSVDLIVALLGIVKMGGSFLAIDTNWPESRINHVISDSKSRLIVTSIGLVGKFLKSGVEVCAFDSENAILKLHDKNNLNVSVTSQSPAYVIFTSGSTGAPKGVIGSHGGLVNRVQWMHKAYPFQAHERSCAKTTLGFVDSITEIFTPLCAGVPLYLFGDQAAKQPSQLVAMLSEHRITRLVLVPSLLHTMLMLHPTDLPKLCPDLKLWEVSGEALSVPLARAFKAAVPSAMLINMYGSSEVGPDATCHEITDHDIRAEATSVPIGTSISNMKCYVLDDDMRPVREGEKGHIYVGGRGVSVRGYINKPDLTAKAFIPNPILKGRELFPVLYKMGDVGSQSVNGVLSFHGRSDHQIKINGNRVELGEIEAAICRLDASISSCAVKFWPLNQSHGLLVAYTAHQSSSQVDIRTLLGRELPAYMVPAQYVTMDALPLNNNGKIDRNALQKPAALPVPVVDAQKHEPFTAKIVSMLQSLVGSELVVSPNTDFSFLGINSLVFAQLRALVAREFGVDLTLQAMLKTSNATELAEKVGLLKLGPCTVSSNNVLNTECDVKHHESPLKGISVVELSADENLLAIPFVDPKTDVEYKLFDATHIDAVTELSCREFCENESLTCHVHSTPADFASVYKPHLIQAARERLSVVAIKDGRVIGATLTADTFYQNILEGDEFYNKAVATNQWPIIDLLACLHTNVEAPVEIPNHTATSLFTVVDPAFMGHELSYSLEKMSMALATQQGYRKIVTELTNPLSQTTARELGYELSPQVTYNQYVDAAGERPFAGLSGGVQLGTLILYVCDNTPTPQDVALTNNKQSSFEDEYQYELLTSHEDAVHVSQEAANMFVKHNPVMAALGISVDEILPVFFDAVTTNGVEEQLTILCRHKASGEIVSCIYNFDPLRPPRDFPVELHTPKLKQFFAFLGELYNKTDLDSVGKTHNLSIISSDFVYASEKHMGRGLGKKQLIMMNHVSRQRGYNAWYGQFTSTVNRRNMADILHSFEPYAAGEIKYSDFQMPDGSRPLAALEGVCLGIVADTQLKPKYAAWASRQHLVPFGGGGVRPQGDSSASVSVSGEVTCVDKIQSSASLSCHNKKHSVPHIYTPVRPFTSTANRHVKPFSLRTMSGVSSGAQGVNLSAALVKKVVRRVLRK